MNISIILCITPEKDYKHIASLDEVANMPDHDLESIGTLTVTGVEEKYEYEISKIIFNRVEMYRLKKENQKLLLKITGDE